MVCLIRVISAKAIAAPIEGSSNWYVVFRIEIPQTYPQKDYVNSVRAIDQTSNTPSTDPQCIDDTTQIINCKYSKTCLKRSLSKRPTLVLKTNYRLMQVKRIAECSKWSILQYPQPSLKYHLSLRPLFCLIFSGCFTLVLL